MVDTVHREQPIELTEELPSGAGVYFDPDELSLEGVYGDQLAAYRARRAWGEALAASFLIETGTDFKLQVVSDIAKGCFVLRCKFLSACGRYAFWRLTNNQAPEAQYLIETGHIAQSDATHEQLLQAPDMRRIESTEGAFQKLADDNVKLAAWIRDLVKKLI